MQAYTFNIQTAGGLHEKVGLSPSDLLDRLADLADDDSRIPALRSLAMTVDQQTGAVTLIFETPATDVRAAVKAAFVDIGRLFGSAFDRHVEFGATIALEFDDPPIERLEVERSDDREAVPA